MNNHSLTAISLCGLLALGACSAIPEGDPNRPDQAQRGAIIGGVTGATIGILRGDNAEERRRGAILGGIAGAGGGAIIGNQLDRQEAALRRDLDDRVLIQNTGDRLIVTLPQDILFAVDSTALRPDLQSDLTALARNLQEFPNSTVRVVGHTDNTGSASYNQDLSERRARSVTNQLVAGGVPTSRLVAIGQGENAPVASNLTDEGRTQNRRVEIVILPSA